MSNRPLEKKRWWRNHHHQKRQKKARRNLPTPFKICNKALAKVGQGNCGFYSTGWYFLFFTLYSSRLISWWRMKNLFLTSMNSQFPRQESLNLLIWVLLTCKYRWRLIVMMWKCGMAISSVSQQFSNIKLHQIQYVKSVVLLSSDIWQTHQEYPVLQDICEMMEENYEKGIPKHCLPKVQSSQFNPTASAIFMVS